jgi:hypothetical protein
LTGENVIIISNEIQAWILSLKNAIRGGKVSGASGIVPLRQSALHCTHVAAYSL